MKIKNEDVIECPECHDGQISISIPVNTNGEWQQSQFLKLECISCDWEKLWDFDVYTKDVGMSHNYYVK